MCQCDGQWRVISFAAAVLLMDDDILISAQDVQFALRVWKVGTKILTVQYSIVQYSIVQYSIPVVQYSTV